MSTPEDIEQAERRCRMTVRQDDNAFNEAMMIVDHYRARAHKAEREAAALRAALVGHKRGWAERLDNACRACGGKLKVFGGSGERQCKDIDHHLAAGLRSQADALERGEPIATTTEGVEPTRGSFDDGYSQATADIIGLCRGAADDVRNGDCGGDADARDTSIQMLNAFASVLERGDHRKISGQEPIAITTEGTGG